jgi:polyisoprenoid-binding protein YceI
MKLFLLLVPALLPVYGQTTRVNLDPEATKVEWTLGDVLHTVHGTFKLKPSELWFDASSGKAGGRLVVDASSGESGSGARDGRMHKNVLESAKFPEIVFTPDHVEGAVNMNGDSDVVLHGSFNIHGAAHEMAMKVKAHMDGDRMTAAIAFEVPYVQWGMKNPSTLFLKVKESVQIDIQAVGKLAAAPVGTR